MKDSLKPGIKYAHKFKVPASKTVPALYPESAEFGAMPEVFATGSQRRHERFVIDKQKFDARVGAKSADRSRGK